MISTAVVEPLQADCRKSHVYSQRKTHKHENTQIGRISKSYFCCRMTLYVNKAEWRSVFRFGCPTLPKVKNKNKGGLKVKWIVVKTD